MGLICINIGENDCLLCEWDSIFGIYKILRISWLDQCKLFTQEWSPIPFLPENDLVLQMRQSLERWKCPKQVELVPYQTETIFILTE
jgi:hypothetical protein